MPVGTFLNSRSPTALRGLQWLSLSDVGTILRSTPVSDGGGGATVTWTAGSVDTWGTAIPTRIVPLSGREAVFGGRLADESSHVVQVPAGVDVTARDRYRVDNRGTFEITAVRERTAGQARFFEVTEIS